MADDRDLPVAAINRIIKESLPEGISVAKDAKVAFVKAATQFIIHCTQYSNDITLKKKRKTMTGEHVLEALTDVEFEDFQDVLQKSLDMFQAEQGDKKKEKGAAKRAAAADGETGSPDAEGEGEGDEEGDAEEDAEEGAENDDDAEE